MENDVSLAEVTSKKAYTYPYPSLIVKYSVGDRIQGGEAKVFIRASCTYRGRGIWISALAEQPQRYHRRLNQNMPDQLHLFPVAIDWSHCQATNEEDLSLEG
jgi:hypothetical protein